MDSQYGCLPGCCGYVAISSVYRAHGLNDNTIIISPAQLGTDPIFANSKRARTQRLR
jgi:hypothetical protein